MIYLPGNGAAAPETLGGTVTVLTMGPPQAEEMMRDAYTMGADDAVILSDRKFAAPMCWPLPIL